LNLGTVAQDNGLALLRDDPQEFMSVPVRLFTMGSPMRQVYANNFPDLYDWSVGPTPHRELRAVQSWINIYRSGDVFGRFLWRSTRDKDAFEPGNSFSLAPEAGSDRFKEYCIGPGSYLQYWDKSSAQAIRDLDAMVVEDYRPSLRIFLSYRRADTQQMISFIHEGLEQRFGSGSVFVDIDRIDMGEDFHQRIQQTLQECDAVVVVIGANWLPVSDWVKAEVEAAIREGKFILPVCVNGAQMPSEGEIPQEIQPLCKLNSARLDSGRDFDLQLRRIGDRLGHQAQESSLQ
jgi:hypothetical protein